jgi:hypothetical protein
VRLFELALWYAESWRAPSVALAILTISVALGDTSSIKEEEGDSGGVSPSPSSPLMGEVARTQSGTERVMTGR